MKNQYFGDINDYLKYGLLRVIAKEAGLRLAVCWMLTDKDDRRDGGKTAYLTDHAKWLQYDPELFGVLKDAVARDRRNIGVAETCSILPETIYHSEILDDDRQKRDNYFEQLKAKAATSNLVFFDPDNGMEVKSKPKGRKGSSKYLYWDEVKRITSLGKSLIVFQHFAREKRDAFIVRLQQCFEAECGIRWVGVLRTSNVVYFVVPAAAHERALQAAYEEVCRRWRPLIWTHL